MLYGEIKKYPESTPVVYSTPVYSSNPTENQKVVDDAVAEALSRGIVPDIVVKIRATDQLMVVNEVLTTMQAFRGLNRKPAILGCKLVTDSFPRSSFYFNLDEVDETDIGASNGC